MAKFERWVREMGLSLLALRAREAAEKGNPVARDYPSEYIKGLIRRGQAKILVNMFAAYLVHRGLATQYKFYWPLGSVRGFVFTSLILKPTSCQWLVVSILIFLQPLTAPWGGKCLQLQDA